MSPFCPKCGADIGNARFCPNCGQSQGNIAAGGPQTTQPPGYYRESEKPRYDPTICFLICCCLTPLGAVLYYLFTEHYD